MRWNWIMAKIMVPPVLVFGIGMLIAVMLRRVDGAPIGIAAGQLSGIVASAGLVAAMAMILYPVYRLLAWERNWSTDCRHCGGPLGWKHDGKVYRGEQLSDYRKCYNCDRNTPD